ncbi:hypothetical protein RvY_07214-2 [Ramazzottius varieornatus]|uniref:BolA-like protein 3 n=1 Tax=Ramazzottius varieornatus TaxID=947166 RepID=A0A1D1V4I7_RAMVA|nr:hypothetical protein RvY_07214-2 [Ramazzottius varieornatus]
MQSVIGILLRGNGLPVQGQAGQLLHRCLIPLCVNREISSRPKRGFSTVLHNPTPDVDCLRPFAPSRRTYATAMEDPAEGERKIKRVLQGSFPKAVKIEVEDVSGGCGSMYQIYIEAEEFRGKKLVEQQRMVNEVLQKEIKAMHGLSLHTAVPKKPSL